jgi:ribosomal protein L30/L7E
MADGILVEVPLRKPREAIVVTLGRRQQNMGVYILDKPSVRGHIHG